jgi:iron complex transport system permease protein
MLVVRLAQRQGTLSVSNFLLAGVAVGAFLWALIYAILLLDQQTLDRILVWLLGSFQLADWQAVWLLGPFVLLPLPLAFSHANSLNAMSLGDDQAAHLGVDTQRAKLQIILLVALMTGAAVSVCGLIGFVGLIVPHIARRLFGPDHRILLPLGTLLGSVFLVLCDLAARSLLSPREIPLGILTALLGAPFFLSLLRRTP